MALFLPDVWKRFCVLPEAGRTSSIPPVGHRSAWVGGRGEFGLPWGPHCVFPAVKLPLAEAKGEQRCLEELGTVVLSWADQVGSLSLKAESIKCQTQC